MKLLSVDKRVEIVAHLVECTSVRATARLCCVDKNTVLSLLMLIGMGCLKLHERLVRGLAIARIEMDEITAPLHTREKNLKVDGSADPLWGHLWTYTAFATVSKLLVAFAHGKRTAAVTDAFLWDVRRRCTLIPEIVTDGLVLYEPAVARSFGLACDYAQLKKRHSKKKNPAIPFTTKRRVVGLPDMDRVSTSGCERLNSTIRDQNKRFVRRSRCHSKTIEGHTAQFALFACFYNMVRFHASLGTTPAVAAGIASEPWSLAQLVQEALAAGDPEPIVPTQLQPREDEYKGAKPLPGGGWLRVIDGGRSKPGIAKGPARKNPAKPTGRRMEQLNLFDLD